MSPKRREQLVLCLGIAPVRRKGGGSPTARAAKIDLISEMKSAYNHRLRMIQWVQQIGIKPTARLFRASTQTVRKW